MVGVIFRGVLLCLSTLCINLNHVMAFDFSASYIKENDIVRLEPLSIEHLNPLSIVAKEKALWTYFLGRSNGQKNFPLYIEDAIQQRKNEKEYPFAVFDKKSRSYVGCTRFFDYSAELKTIRLGYSWIGKKHRGTGLNISCKQLLFELAFEDLNLERIGLGAHAENKRSIAAMLKVGCKKEGEIRNLFPSINSSGRANAILMGILKEEWLDIKKRK